MFWQFLKKKQESYDPAIPLLDGRELKTCAHTNTSVQGSIIHNSQKYGNSPNVHQLMNG